MSLIFNRFAWVKDFLVKAHLQPKPFQDCWRLLKAFKKLIFFTLLVAMQAASNFLNVAITFWFLVPYIPLACHLKQKVFVWKEMKTIGIFCKLLQWHKDLGLVKKNSAEPMHLQKWVIHATVLIRLALHSFQSTSEIACAQCKQEYILWKMF